MFSNTAYETLYQYIGLELHARFIEILTSQKIFMAMALIIFGSMFLLTTLQFFSRYLPGALVKRKSVPLSKYVKITACLFAGLSILRIGSTAKVSNFEGRSWHDNPYVVKNSTSRSQDHRVSALFDGLSRSAEEFSRLVNRVVDKVFQSTNSELEAPSFFYKAILYAGGSTLSDPEARSAIDRYTNECIERVLPFVESGSGDDRMDSAFKTDASLDQKLSTFAVSPDGRVTCLDLKNDVRRRLKESSAGQPDQLSTVFDKYLKLTSVNETTYENLKMSMALVDHYVKGHEAPMGIQRASQPIGGAARVFQYVNRLFSWDGLVSLFGRETHGAVLAAERSQEFSENLTRAPHVAGFIKMSLIAIFPWLVFPVIAGYWRILVWWMLGYTSVLLWAPIWTLFYHVMTGISLSAETMAAFGELSDGISLYSANLVTSRMNYMYSVYSWVQLLIGGAFTGSILWFAKPILGDSESEGTPEFVGDASRAVGTVGAIV